MKTIEIKECTKLKAIRNEVVKKLNADITKKNRNRELVYGRAVYYKLCKNLTSHSLTDIGSFIYKDHATVLHGLKVFETFELNERNKSIRVLIKREFKDIFNECRKEFGYVPQTAYLKQRFAKINELLKKNS